MSTSEETVRDPANIAKWVVAVVLLIAATMVARVFPDMAVAFRGLIMVALGIIALTLVLITAQGRSFLDLFAASRIELRKVVWPTKPETWQTTLIVLVVVVITSLILWAMDSLFGFAISAVIG